MRLSVIIPMYNEEERIVNNLKILIASLKKELSETEFEVLVVNDGSTDHSFEKVEALSKSEGTLSLLSYEVNRGKGGALKEGMCASTGDFAVFTDSDLAYGAEMVSTFFHELEKGDADLVLGSRAISKDGYEGYSLLRKWMSGMYLSVVKAYAGFRYSDSQCGMKGFTGEAAHKLFSALETEGFAFDLEILLRAKKKGYRVKEHPVKVLNHGRSSIHPVRDACRMLRDLYKIKKRLKKEQ